ncbi:MAG: thiosulfate oxidation carrier complex protein SoxZ [Gammaproteobacteria bacterium]
MPWASSKTRPSPAITAASKPRFACVGISVRPRRPAAPEIRASDISISEDPSFRFFFKPRDGGILTAEMRDSKGRQITRSFAIAGSVAVAD